MNLEKLKQAAILMRLHRPIGILLVLWPTLWGLWLAGEGHPSFFIVAIFILGTLVMRSAGCIINDIADRKWDGFVKRTRERPLVTGKVSVKEAFGLFFVLLLLALGLVLLLNRFTLLLACVGVLLAVIYPLLKRVTHLPQFGLGAAFSWGIPMAFAAQNKALSVHVWLLFFSAAVWPVIYDTFYAMVDRADDIKVGIKSTAILFGKWDKWILAVLQITFLLLMTSVGYFFQLTQSYFYGLLVAGILFIYQQVLIKDRIAEKCFQAFLNSNWVGCVIFLGIVLSFIL